MINLGVEMLLKSNKLLEMIAFAVHFEANSFQTEMYFLMNRHSVTFIEYPEVGVDISGLVVRIKICVI